MDKQSMYVLAIDPGITTGLAWTTPEGYETATMKDDIRIWDFIRQSFPYPWVQIVLEQFQTAGRISKYGLATRELIGGIRAMAYEHMIPVLMVSPQHRYPYQVPAHVALKRTREKFLIHQEDALAHLLCYLELGK